MIVEAEPLTSGVAERQGPSPELAEIADKVRRGEGSPTVSVRQLLRWFGAQRRGYYVVQTIRNELTRLGIQSVPDFNEVWIDAEVTFSTIAAPDAESTRPLGQQQAPASPSDSEDQSTRDSILVGGPVSDPTYRIGKLEAANKPVFSVSSNQSLEEAITLMLTHGFSQLPVMQGERDVKGVISWESIGARLALGLQCGAVRDCMSPPQIIGSEQSLFAAIEVIAEHQYVLVQTPDRRISGIVTAADLSRQFHQLSEPFLLLGEIEQHVRTLIVGKFTLDEIRRACNRTETARDIQDVADLTMGEYIRLLENPAHWGKTGLRIDRNSFIAQLQVVRRIRNDVMHFDPDPLTPDDLAHLRRFAIFMQSLRAFGAIQ